MILVQESSKARKKFMVHARLAVQGAENLYNLKSTINI